MNFNPCSPCGERRVLDLQIPRCEEISIHAPRAGSDPREVAGRAARRNFNPCSPCGERPGSVAQRPSSVAYFNPCSPCGERPFDGGRARETDEISIHAPRAGSDGLWGLRPHLRKGFQSMLPVRGATRHPAGHPHRVSISIHAPRAGSDQRGLLGRGKLHHFNPCSPCGERPARPAPEGRG